MKRRIGKAHIGRPRADKKYMMKKWIALGLCAVMTAQCLAGCGSKANSGNGGDGGSKAAAETEEEGMTPPIAAEDVEFNSGGNYMATVTSDVVDLSAVKAEDVAVTYNVIDEAGYEKALAEAANAQETADAQSEDTAADSGETAAPAETTAPADIAGDDADASASVDVSAYMQQKQAKVESVKAEQGKLELSFSDPDAGTNLTEYYNVTLNGTKYPEEYLKEVEEWKAQQ